MKLNVTGFPSVLSLYLVLSPLMGGGVWQGEVERSTGCSGFSESEGGAGGWTLGGVDELLRDDEEPLRDTQDVSMTRTPILHRDTYNSDISYDTRPVRTPSEFQHTFDDVYTFHKTASYKSTGLQENRKG